MGDSKIPDIVSVLWVDSSLQDGQVDHHNYPKPEKITSVGYLIEETDEYVTIARDGMNSGDFRGLLCVPRVAILSKVTIRSFN